MTGPRVAVVHERFTERGGSEAVVDHLAAIWPSARLFAPIIDAAALPANAASLEYRSSFLQRLYRDDGRYSHLLPLLPLAMSRADFDDADVVITSHHAFSNRIRPEPHVPIVSYVHSPARWIWDRSFLLGEAGGRIASLGFRAFAASQRRADRVAAQRVRVLVANSSTVADRIERWWDRDAIVIPPPVDIEFFTPDETVEREDFFLLAGRHVPYKRPEVAVAAATAAGVPLVVAGSGRALAGAKALAGPNVSFLSDVNDEELRNLFRRCRALVFPGIEDFGIIPVEAQACGSPVIGVDQGGLQDTVMPGVSGVLVPYEQSVESQVANLSEVLGSFDPVAFDQDKILLNAQQFGIERFRESMERVVTEVLKQ